MFKTITGLLLSRLPRRNFLEPSEPCPRYNLPELASGTYTTTHRNPRKPGGTYLPENSGTCLRNLPSGTYTDTGTLRNLPEPSSGTCSCDPHRHTPELIWAIQTPLAYAVGEKSTKTEILLVSRWDGHPRQNKKRFTRASCLRVLGLDSPVIASRISPMVRRTTGNWPVGPTMGTFFTRLDGPFGIISYMEKINHIRFDVFVLLNKR